MIATDTRRYLPLRNDLLARTRRNAPRIAATILVCAAVAYGLAEAGIAVFRWWFGL